MMIYGWSPEGPLVYVGVEKSGNLVPGGMLTCLKHAVRSGACVLLSTWSNNSRIIGVNVNSSLPPKWGFFAEIPFTRSIRRERKIILALSGDREPLLGLSKLITEYDYVKIELTVEDDAVIVSKQCSFIKRIIVRKGERETSSTNM